MKFRFSWIYFAIFCYILGAKKHQIRQIKFHKISLSISRNIVFCPKKKMVNLIPKYKGLWEAQESSLTLKVQSKKFPFFLLSFLQILYLQRQKFWFLFYKSNKSIHFYKALGMKPLKFNFFTFKDDFVHYVHELRPF